jgi:ribose 5-phosphate isomerase A
VLRQLAARVPRGARLMDRDRLKREAATAAAALVESGMTVGLGTGSTAALAIELLGERWRAGLRFTGVPTSDASAVLARRYDIPLIESPTDTQVDLTIDGADEIGEADLNMIKGMGGALLREKIVAVMSRRVVIIADATKLSPRLSGRVPIPVEVVPFGWESTKARVAALGCRPILKRTAEGAPYHTDGGHFILNCKFDAIADPAATDLALSRIVGVVETGLFIDLATTILVASDAGIRRIER